MTAPEHTAQRGLALTLMARRTGPAAGAETIAAAADCAYDDLAQVLATVVGDVGVAAMTDRALHLATRDCAWLPSREPGSADTQFTQVIEALQRQDPTLATEAAAAVLGGNSGFARHVHRGTDSGAAGAAGVGDKPDGERKLHEERVGSMKGLSMPVGRGQPASP